uniref:Pentacotripeptide-repeat region of PRORP domain-containing protein n=1 Tax=Salix viminalis TaxID=40686 RepID=A0A6N2NLE9_SALVM
MYGSLPRAMSSQWLIRSEHRRKKSRKRNPKTLKSHFQWPFLVVLLTGQFLPINSCRKPHKIIFTQTCKTLHFLPLPSFNIPVFHLNSSSCPSPIIEEESSTNSPVIQLDLRLEGPQHYPIPEHSDKLNDFLCGLLRDPKSEELAHEYYKKAKEKQGFRPERSMLKLLIRYLIQSEKWAMKGYNKLHMYGSTLSVHEKMKLAGIPLDSGCYFQIMKAHHKLGDAERVVEMFNEFESRKLDSKPMILSQIYKILCESLGRSGQAVEALAYFRDMRKKGILEDSSLAEELYKEAQEKRMLKDPETFLKLVLIYMEEGQMEKTIEIVKGMKGTAKLKVSDCIFCAIVNGFSKRRGFDAAIKVYEELKSDGCEPGQVTFASVINAYCRVGLYSKAENAFFEMEKKGFDKCVVAYSSIISMYGKTGRPRDAMRLVAKMKLKGCQPNVWIYNSLVEMHGRAKNLRQVEKLWKEMERRKVAPDKVTYTSVISAYNKSKEYEMCVRFYHEYRINGGVIDGAIAGIMVGVFSKINRIDELLKLLRDMKSEGSPIDERLYVSATNAMVAKELRSKVT